MEALDPGGGNVIVDVLEGDRLGVAVLPVTVLEYGSGLGSGLGLGLGLGVDISESESKSMLLFSEMQKGMSCFNTLL